jgi:hypothetical protein
VAVGVSFYGAMGSPHGPEFGAAMALFGLHFRGQRGVLRGPDIGAAWRHRIGAVLRIHSRKVNNVVIIIGAVLGTEIGAAFV